MTDDSPPLSPRDALATFYMAPGYRVELVASEPLVQAPVAIDWDLHGRLWVVEMPGYMRNVTGGNEHDPIGRIVVLEDTDRDGTMDKRTVFADGLVLARAIKVLEHGVLVGEPPNVWLMHDTNGDLRMDTKDLVTSEYGQLDADPRTTPMDSSGRWTIASTPPGRSTFSCITRQESSRSRRRCCAANGASPRTMPAESSEIRTPRRCTRIWSRRRITRAIAGCCEHVAAMRPSATRTNRSMTVWPVRPNPGTNRAYQAGIDRQDGTLASYTAVCAPLIYRGDRLPSDLYGNLFVAEPAANVVSRIVVSDDGTTLKARKAYERAEFLASTDERFRPVYLSNAPDGTMYVVDLYRGILEHRNSLTVYSAQSDYVQAPRRADEPRPHLPRCT